MDKIKEYPLLLRVMSFVTYLPFVYLIAVMFFIPDGDSYIAWFMVSAMLISFYYRLKTSYWGIGGHKTLVYPVFVYTTVLTLSYVFQGGFASAVRPFVFFSFFLYLSLPALVSLEKLRYLFILSGFELAAVSFYQHGFLHISRIGGFTNPIFWGTFSCCNALFCLYLSESVTQKRVKALFYISSLASVYAMIMSGTRGVWLAFIPIFIIYIIYVVRTFNRPLVSLSVVIAFLGVILMLNSGLVDSRISQAVLQTKNYINSINSTSPNNVDSKKSVDRTSVGLRFTMWKFSLSAFMESPVWGLGRDGAEQAKLRYVEEGLSSPSLLKYQKGHVHNQYLQELVMRGLIGFFSLLLLLFSPLLEGLRRMRKQDWSGYAVFSLSLAYATFSLTEASLKHPYKIYVYLFFMAFLFLLPRQPAINS